MAVAESAVGICVAEEANIDAYFERIGFAGSIAPTLETLSLLQQQHPAAIPFENLDPLIGVPVRLDLSDLQQKLLFDRRGGYCFEHNLLFKAVLEALDFPVKAHGATVLLGRDGEEPPEDHLVLTVEVGGATYLADVGFGGMTPTAPLRLRADLEQATPHETYRLIGGDPLWWLEVKIGDDWRAMFAFNLNEKSVGDLMRMNEQVANSPDFRDNLKAARSERGRRLALANRRLNIHTVGGETETRMLESVAEIREVLAGPFGIALPNDERLETALQQMFARDSGAV